MPPTRVPPQQPGEELGLAHSLCLPQTAGARSQSTKHTTGRDFGPQCCPDRWWWRQAVGALAWAGAFIKAKRMAGVLTQAPCTADLRYQGQACTTKVPNSTAVRLRAEPEKVGTQAEPWEAAVTAICDTSHGAVPGKTSRAVWTEHPAPMPPLCKRCPVGVALSASTASGGAQATSSRSQARAVHLPTRPLPP